MTQTQLPAQGPVDVNVSQQDADIKMTNYPPRYSDSWKGQDGREWRKVSYWNGRGWQTFLQVKTTAGWQGW